MLYGAVQTIQKSPATHPKPARPNGLLQALARPKVYAGYFRCCHCGIYDSNPHWCDLCGRPKDARVRGVDSQSAPDS